ncbi:hypothetical protein Tco_1391794 [Tanacetum coccineum]
MSNTNTNLQTQTSNALHNAIMEAGGKDRPPMLAPGNYVQWKSRIKRYIDTKPNNEHIHYCLQNPPYKFKWTEKTVPVAEGSSETTTEGYMENYKNVSQDIRNQLDAKAEAFGKFTSRDGESLESYYLRSQQAATKNRGKTIVNSPLPTYDQEPEMVAEDDALSKEKEIDKLVALISLSFKKIYKSTNNNLRTSSNISRENQDNTLRSNRDTGYDNQRAVNVTGARENVGTHVIQEVTPDAANNSGPIFDVEPLQKVKNDDDNYNVFANDSEHHEQLESVNDTCLKEHGDTNITIDSLDMSTNGETVEQDDDDLAKECDLLASLIEKLKCEIDDSKNHLKKFQAKLHRYHDVNYASKVEIDCAKAKGEMKKELFAHQETISIMSQEKEAQKKFHKTRKDKKLEKVIALENKIKVLDDIVYKTGQSVQTMNMLNPMSRIDKNDKAFKETQSKVFLKEREQYFEIQDLKAQLQDKGIAISELKKLIEKMKGKYVETKFEKSSVIRQPNAFKSQRQSVLVTAHILSQNVKSNLKNTNVISLEIVISTTSVSRPQLKSNRLEDRVMYKNSEGKKQQVDDNRRNFKTKMPMAVPISTREPKRTVNQSAATPLKRTIAA